ncbi:MAG: lipopolysaccharide biosynthesis protein [Gallionellaceae bacterium]
MEFIIFSYIKTKLAILRFTPFDISSDSGRSQERYRRLALSSLTSVVARGISILTSLISVPLTVNYLGPERYGMWMTASSVIILLGFADLGMGNGLLNAISEADGNDDRDAAATYVSSAFFMLLGIAGVILSLFGLVYFLVPWPRVFNVVSDLAMRESGPAMAVFVISLAINMPLGVAQRVQMGYQEGFKTNLWGVAGSLIGFCGVLLAIYVEAGLPWLVFAMLGGPTLAMLFNWLELFCSSRKWLLPRLSTFDWAASRKVAGTGVFFLILQVMTLIGSASDNLVIAQILGASAVSVYAVTQKLFTATMIAQYFIAPLWPAFGEALARKDYTWAKKTLYRALKLSFALSAVTAVPLFLFGKEIIYYWVGAELIPTNSLLAGFAVFVFLASYGGVMSTFLNNGDLVRPQVIFFSAASVTALILKVFFTYQMGIAGAIWATVFGYSIFYVVPAARLAYQYLNDQAGLNIKIC